MTGLRLRLITGTALALTGTACAGTALADTKLGWYVAADAGHDLSSSQALQVTDVTLTSASPGATAPAAAGRYTLKPDYAAEGFARVGYRITPNLRAEIEAGMRPGTVVDGLGSSRTADLGAFDKTSLMVNGVYDIRPDLPLHPFVGVGAGIVRVKTDYRETGGASGHAFSYAMAGDKTVPAAQMLAGASWDVTQSLHFDMTWRYLRTASTAYTVAMSDTHGATTDNWTAKARGPIEDQSLSVGLRWTFGGGSSVAPSYADAPPAPVVKPEHTGLHFPALSLPFTHSRKAEATAPASAAPVAAAQADPMPQATVAPLSVKAASAPVALASPTTQAGEAETNPGADAASTAKAPKRFFASTARAPGQTASAPKAVAAPATPSAGPASEAPLPVKPASTMVAAPTARVPAAKARRFTAYFPLGGARLDDKARGVVTDAVHRAQSAPAAQVQVDGYADTSGGAAYNMGLSRRRATAVADALKAGGVAADAITLAWHGETHPAVRAHDGVACAGNRRVTIGIHFGKAKVRAHRHHHRRHRHHR